MKCCDFYFRVCAISASGCDEFRYCDSSSGKEFEVGYLDSDKIASQSVLELKGIIGGWNLSERYVGARMSSDKGIPSVVLFESMESEDPKGVSHIFCNNDGIMIVSGFVKS